MTMRTTRLRLAWGRLLSSMLFIGLLTVTALAEDTPKLPFHLPVPEGWRTETIPFPLGFAPEIEYEGLEELRFSPGMFDPEKDDFWSYAFIWWIPASSKIEAAKLATELEAYFRGLGLAVAKSNDFEPKAPVFEASITELEVKQGNRAFSGQVETLDAFATRESVHLEVNIESIPCGSHQAVFFGFSPQPASHPVWTTLAGLRQGFDCEAGGRE